MSVVLYIFFTDTISGQTLKKKNFFKKLGTIQMRGTLIVVSSFKTVSEPAVLVVAGLPPIDLPERIMCYQSKGELKVKA